MNPTGLMRCVNCLCLTTAAEAALRKINTGRCSVCGGMLAPIDEVKMNRRRGDER